MSSPGWGGGFVAQGGALAEPWGPFSVVVFLIGNVTTHLILLGMADTKCAVSILPVEMAHLEERITKPARRVGLDRSQMIRQRLVLSQLGQDVDVIGSRIG